MTFTVQGKPLRGGDDVSLPESSPTEAMKKAPDLIGQGFSNVRILADGRAYTTMEFAAAFGTEKSNGPMACSKLAQEASHSERQCERLAGLSWMTS